MGLFTLLARRGVDRVVRSGRTGRGYASFLRSLTRRRPHYIRQRWPGAVDLQSATRVAVLMHFDRDGAVHDYVHYYVEQMSKAGFATIFVSNAPRLQTAAIDRLAPMCAGILRRDNVGYDFGALKDGMGMIPALDRVALLLLANDSVYGPFHDLGAVIDRMNFGEADVWGITDSWARRFHLQSFFLAFGRRALASEAFRRFWSRLRYVQAKTWIVDHYEIGLTRALIRDGLRCRALFPYRDAATQLVEAVRQRRTEFPYARSTPTHGPFLESVVSAVEQGIPLNPAHAFWAHLIARMGCPFVKRELLRDNPVRIPGLIHWEALIRSVSDYNTDLIARHLELTVRRRAV